MRPPPTISIAQALPDPRRGILLMLLGIALFSILNGVVKAQMELFPVNQIVFFRNALALIPVLFLVRTMGGWTLLRTERTGHHVLLGLLFTSTLFCMFWAYSMMPLADATAIAFTQPLMVMLLSLFVVTEAVRRVEWVAVAIGLAGVLIMVQPSGGASMTGTLLALFASFMSACSMLVQRRLSRSDASISITFHTLAVSAALMVPTLPVSWVMPTPLQLAGLVAMGLASGLCQYLTVRALYHATASAVAPVNYTKMFWAVVIGFVWFGEIPTLAVILAAGLVICATLLTYGGQRPQVLKGGPEADP